MYNTIGNQDIAFLYDTFGREKVLVGDEISADYSHDELGGISKTPDVLVKPDTTEEISKLMAYADSRHIPVVARGSGTGLVGASVALEGGIMLETLGMNKILELDEENLTVTVQPGVLLMELAEFAESNGFLYPPDPGEKSATIGGNISTNAGGMRAVKYGVTRDYVMGLTVVLPNGKIEKLGGKVVKNSTGYSLLDLFVGSEGTLGIITEAVLKLVPLPKITTSMLVPFHSIDEAIDTVPKIIKSKASLTAIEFFEREAILFSEEYLGKKFPDAKHSAYLLLTVDGNEESFIEKELSMVADLCLESGARDAYFVDTDERKESVWQSRGAFLEAIKASTSEMDECDVVVPRNKVAEFIKYAHTVSEQVGVRIPSFGHAGDGNLHIYVCRDDLPERDWKAKLDEAFALLYNKANELNGFVSGEHGIGYAKKEFMLNACGENQIELMRGIKNVFDKNNILNPGKLF